MLSPTDFYLLRCPSFPIKNLSILENAIKEKEVEKVKKILSHNFFLNAIYFSSKFFYDIAIEWLGSVNSINYEDKILISLYKYYNRLCTRSTPYGLFAGFAMGKITDDRSLFEFRQSEYSFDYLIRPDMLYVEKVKENLLKYNNNVKYYPNNTLYKIGDKIRYIDYDVNKNFSISDIEISEILSLLIPFVESGKTACEIRSFISEKAGDATKEEVDGYFGDLIFSKVLVNNTPPYITGSDNILDSLDKFFKENGIKSSMLTKIALKIKDIDHHLNTNSSLYKIYNRYPNKDQDIQIDLKLNMNENKINTKVIELICNDLNNLGELSKSYKISTIEEFKNRFYRKYEAQEVPLIEALDPQIGVGYDLQISGNVDYMPLIEGIEFSGFDTNPVIPYSALVNYIYRNYSDHFDKKSIRKIELTDGDITHNTTRKSRNKSVFSDYYLLGKILSKDVEELDKGNFKFHSLYSLPSPMMSTIYSRFAYSDRNLAQKLKKYAKTTANKVIHAEIIHQPEGRIGNVLLRPSIYEYEVPYVSHSNPNANVISIQDLTIKIVRNRIVLRSKILDREIIPRLSSAHNFSREQLPLFRFLGDLQFSDKDQPFKWSWAQFKEHIYLPRVEYKHIILALAQWKIFKDQNINDNKLEKIIKENNIPNHCEIKDREDNVMKLDLNNPLCRRILKKRLRRFDVTLYEAIEASPLKVNGELYNNEVAFSFIGKSKEKQVKEVKKKKENVQRNYLPGDEWTFLKIYCSHGVADEIIVKLSNVFSKIKGIWHFIRYEDPYYHLRFRIKNRMHSEILDAVKKELKILVDNQYIYSISQDTYSRELERYGFSNIGNTESFFFYDSLSASEVIKSIRNLPDIENVRWIAAITSVDKIFDDFKVPYVKRIKYMKTMFENFQSEFVDHFKIESKISFNKSINVKYKRYKTIIHSILTEEKTNEFQIIRRIYADRSRENKEVVKTIINDYLVVDDLVYDLLSSYVHMTLNRLFVSKPRMHETVIYYFLFRAYNKIYYTNE